MFKLFNGTFQKLYIRLSPLKTILKIEEKEIKNVKTQNSFDRLSCHSKWGGWGLRALSNHRFEHLAALLLALLLKLKFEFKFLNKCYDVLKLINV